LRSAPADILHKLGAALSEMLVDQLEKLVMRIEGISNNKPSEFYRYDRIQGLNYVMGGDLKTRE
jgi:hypothetical protein